MSSLESFITLPRLIEIDSVDVAAPAERAHDVLRHMDLRRSALVRGLLLARRVPLWRRGPGHTFERLGLDELVAHHGFRVLVDDATTFAAGCERFVALEPAGPLTLGWEIRCSPLGERAARVTVEVRATTDDEEVWRRFERAFRVLGPVARLVRRHVLALVVGDLGGAGTAVAARPLRQTV